MIYVANLKYFFDITNNFLFFLKQFLSELFQGEFIYFQISTFNLLPFHCHFLYLQAFFVCLNVFVEAFDFFFGGGDGGADVVAEDLGFEPVGEVNLLKLFSPTGV